MFTGSTSTVQGYLFCVNLSRRLSTYSHVFPLPPWRCTCAAGHRTQESRIKFDVNPDIAEKRMIADRSWYLCRLPQTFGHDVPDE